MIGYDLCCFELTAATSGFHNFELEGYLYELEDGMLSGARFPIRNSRHPTALGDSENHTLPSWTERHLLDWKLLTSQESPVYWRGQEQSSTVYAGPPVPVLLASSRPTSPRMSRWLWVKYNARILRPTRPDRTLISSSLETGLLVMAWRQFPCKLQTGYFLTHTGKKQSWSAKLQI